MVFAYFHGVNILTGQFYVSSAMSLSTELVRDAVLYGVSTTQMQSMYHNVPSIHNDNLL